MNRIQQKQNRLSCCSDVDRRGFLSTAAGAAVAASTLPGLARHAAAAPTPNSSAETAVKRLYDSLSEDQKPVVALSLDDERRKTINPNWSITKASVGKFFNLEQQEIIKEILRGITSEDGYDRFLKQMAHDWKPGLDRYI